MTAREHSYTCGEIVVNKYLKACKDDLPRDFLTNKDSDSSLPKDDYDLIVRRVLGREFKRQPCEEPDCAAAFWRHGYNRFRANWPAHLSSMAPTFMNTARATRRNAWPSATRREFPWHDCDELHPGVVKFVSEWPAQGRNCSH